MKPLVDFDQSNESHKPCTVRRLIDDTPSSDFFSDRQTRLNWRAVPPNQCQDCS